MPKKLYQYLIYDLVIHSEISLEPLIQCDGDKPYDVYIKTGPITPPPENLDNTIYKPSTIYNSHFFYWNVPDIATYLIEDGNLITVDKEKGSYWQDVRAFLLDTILTVVLLMNQKFVFHASCVASEQGAFLFCTTSGSGKSTLAGLLVHRGFQFIEDDRCLLQWDKDQQVFNIQNHYPLAQLWSNSKIWRNNSKAVYSGKVRKNIQKEQFYLGALVVPVPSFLKKIFLINMDNGEDRIDKEEIKGMAKVNNLKNYTHFYHLIKGLGLSKIHFKVISKIAATVPIIKVDRSQLTPVSQFAKFMTDEITG